jgi:4-hydroxythreonine-4-phosphate dehydrogenase
MTGQQRTIAIALGDPGGIGPEVALKAIAAEPLKHTRYLLFGDLRLVEALVTSLRLKLRIVPAEKATAKDRVQLLQPLPCAIDSRLPSGSPEHARAALAWLRAGAQCCLRDDAHALVTAPVNKESIIRAGKKEFVGQTELLSALACTRRTAMMLLGHDERGRWLRVALATIHVPLKDVPRSLTRRKVELAIELAAEACEHLKLPRHRVAICGLNPHAGEGGLIGTEEKTVITPAVVAARRRGLDVIGPLAADTLFHHALRGDYDAVVAMYHDQGLAPLKMIAFDTGVNWTLGLPFVRTSPDHGTAYDIAGRGVADPSSMRAAIRLAAQLTVQR